MSNITKKDAVAAYNRLQGIQKRIAGIREKAEATTERLVAAAEVTGAAFAMGVLQGRTYDPVKKEAASIFGVPAELGLGIGLTGFALLGGAGKHSSHLANIGTGCLAAYTSTLGRGVGATWKAKEAQHALPTSSGVLSPAQQAMAAAAMAGA